MVKTRTIGFLLVWWFGLNFASALEADFDDDDLFGIIETIWNDCENLVLEKGLDLELARLTAVPSQFGQPLKNLISLKKKVDKEMFCQFGVLGFLSEIERDDKSNAEYAEEMSQAFSILGDDEKSEKYKQSFLEKVQAAALVFAVNLPSQQMLDQFCTGLAISSGASCLNYVANQMGTTLPFHYAESIAMVDFALRVGEAIISFREGRLSPAELELVLGADFTAVAGGMAGASAGCWLSTTTLATILGPLSIPFAGMACVYGGSYGYAFGSATGTSFLDQFFEGKLSATQQREQCRKLFGVSDKSPTSKIRKAYRKLSKKTHPDKGGDTAKHFEVNVCLGILMEASKKDGFLTDSYFQQAWELIRPERFSESGTHIRCNSRPEYSDWADTGDTRRMQRLLSSPQTHQELLDWLDRKPHMSCIRSSDGRGPMWWAHEFGAMDMVESFVRAGIPMTDRDANGFLPSDLYRPAK